jgi:hypothetical protein
MGVVQIMMLGRPERIVVRLGLVSLAALMAILGTELVVRFGVRYPPRPERRNFRMKDGLGLFSVLQWDAPHSGFWNVEAGNKVYHYNNLGLPGGDVRTDASAQYVFLLGSSWVEAMQMPPGKTAGAILQARLAARGDRQQVLNLGSSGIDPYVAWFRCHFFALHYPPVRVVLVLESLHTRWLLRHPHPLDFTLPAYFGTEQARTGVRRIVARLRGLSSFVNLLTNGAPRDLGREAAASLEGAPAPGSAADADTLRMSTDLKQCLREFQRDYGDRFLLVSLLDHVDQRRELADFCGAEGLALVPAPTLLRSENRFKGTGHLNERGNQELGAFLDEALAGYDPQP